MNRSFDCPFVSIGRLVPIVLVTLTCLGCGTFQLSSGAIPLVAKSQEQMQLDNLTCKDQAKLAANTGERQAGAFLLGATLIGAPIAFELEKSKQREVYKSCMETRGYRVLPPADVAATQAAENPSSARTGGGVSGGASSKPASSQDPLTSRTQSAPQSRDEVFQLQKLKELREKDLITSEEYERKRKEILDKL